MSMINISGVPNMGFAGGGGGSFAPSGIGQLGIGDLGYYNKAPTGIGADQALYNSIFNNFGQQTDYYSGLGAAYGRATGGFGAPGSNPGWQAPEASPSYDTNGIPSGGATMGSLFDQGAKSGSLGSMDMFGGYQPQNAGLSAYENATRNMPLASGYPGGFPGGYFNPSLYQPATPPSRPVEDVSSWFTQLAGGGGGSAYPLGGYGGFDPFGGGGGGAGPGGSQSWQQALTGGWGKAPAVMPNMQALLGYDPGRSASFAPQQNPSPFFGAFSQFPGNATPSQYTYQPYTNAQGQTFQPNMPQGFAPLYDVDNPKGALPLNWNSQAGGA